ncbi:hypothetical protein AAMO2058_000226300 [Amorphochlora amoebiformis]
MLFRVLDKCDTRMEYVVLAAGGTLGIMDRTVTVTLGTWARGEGVAGGNLAQGGTETPYLVYDVMYIHSYHSRLISRILDII